MFWKMAQGYSYNLYKLVWTFNEINISKSDFKIVFFCDINMPTLG